MAWRNEAPGTGLAAPGGGGRRQAARAGSGQTQTAAPPETPDTEAYPDWDAIYTDNVGRIYRLLFAKVGNRPDAEDLTSQVFLAALGPLRTTASVGEVRAYLLATARTALAAHWRKTLGHQVTVIDPAGMDLAEFAGTADGSRPGGSAGLDPPFGGAAPDPGPQYAGEPGRDPQAGPGRAHDREQDRAWDEDRADWAPDDPRLRADRILAALPDRQRRILILRFLQGCSVKEAAAELGVTVANAKVLQHRALRRAAGLDREPDRKGDA
ncbi:MAG TPA: sigma-70 family RNA polymerase sigma factor [Actinocrinis sp.]|nr:sigma-70 family RNA polymerase sigma factor [Actinocrinis sp.]